MSIKLFNYNFIREAKIIENIRHKKPVNELLKSFAGNFYHLFNSVVTSSIVGILSIAPYLVVTCAANHVAKSENVLSFFFKQLSNI